MAHGHGNSVGSIQHHWCVLEVEEGFDHELDLLFRCVPVSDDRFFYFARRVFCGREVSLDCCEQAHAPRVPQLQRRLRIFPVEGTFNRELIRLERADHFPQSGMDFLQPEGEGVLRTIADGAAGEEPDRLSVSCHDSEARHERSRIHAEHDQGAGVPVSC